MGKKKIFIALTFVTLLVLPAAAVGLIDSMTLVAKGDARYMGFIKVYDAHLYVPAEVDHNRILDTDVSKCLELNYEVGLKPEDFIKGASIVLERQHTKEHLDLIKPHVEALHAAYRPVDKGDSYILCYEAESKVTTLSLNTEQLVAIESEEFSSAYFGIWLSPNQPLSSSLQRQLPTAADGTSRKGESR